VKRLNMVGRRDEVEDLTREISLMKELEHPNIVAYIGSYVSVVVRLC
jgi:serine/threonine protein kinase